MYCSVWGEEEELNVLFSLGRRGRTKCIAQCGEKRKN